MYSLEVKDHAVIVDVCSRLLCESIPFTAKRADMDENMDMMAVTFTVRDADRHFLNLAAAAASERIAV